MKKDPLIASPTSQVVVDAIYPSVTNFVYHDLLFFFRANIYQYLDFEQYEINAIPQKFRNSSARNFVDSVPRRSMKEL